ncbi:SEC14-like protein 4 [Folsomia candida]|uniref:CRAL-TRIO domain-containing protein n=1 Tax=Folsomia candida TaxID=158441 RepID=A0A226DG39_FOLCA|nr:SEC14-like protein 4 [Folsomia candida]OXA44535.1 hypothetical protein Fcan01_20415 [Folsomia candida]
MIYSRKAGSVIILIISVFTKFSAQISLNEFLTLTEEQKIKLDIFRELIISRLPEDYMKEDVYIIRWLRDSNFDIPTAEKRLMNMVSWRQENQMDTILQEDWAKSDYEFKIYIEGCDRDKKPVISVSVDWDIRRMVISGESKKLMRYIDRTFEEAEQMARRMIADGQNVTQLTMMFDLSNFNLIEQACGRCLPIYFHLITTYQDHFAGLLHKIIIINAPEVFVPLYDALKPALFKNTRDLITVLGRDKAHSLRFLMKEMDKDQLSRKYLGSKKESLDFQELRDSGEVYRCTNV